MVQVEESPRVEFPMIVSESLESVLSPMEFPQFSFDRQQLKAASAALKSDLPFETEADKARALEVFQVAHSWRDSHAYPMTRVRRAVAGQCRRLKIKCFSAARVKQMKSIRKKLHGSHIGLWQMQDLGGCRAVVTTIADVRAVVAACQDHLPHKLFGQNDYISEIKDLGYRSYHLKYEFQPSDDDEEPFAKRRIEIQIRTRLQHSWATATEAVGLYLNEDMKHGQGDARWLRLFRLIAEEFALTEGCLPDETLSERKRRLQEIRDIDADVKALSTLESVNSAFKYVEDYKFQDRTKFVVLTFDRIAGRVGVRGFDDPKKGAGFYDSTDIRSRDVVSVMVELDRIENLQAAYPNYFGDVKVFADNLRRITKGKLAKEFALPKQQVVPIAKPLKIDPRWLYRRVRG